MAVGVYHQCRHSFRPFIILYAIKFHEINFNTYHEVCSETQSENNNNKKHSAKLDRSPKQIEMNFKIKLIIFRLTSHIENAEFITETKNARK